MNAVKTCIGLADFFLGKNLKILMHLGIVHFLSSIEIHLLKVAAFLVKKNKFVSKQF